jgi:3'-phosphoadenosine 5'-phosphosulfate sulfotransferase (PAPS reductase)/FAD synthetase
LSSNTRTYIVLFSGGLASFEAARRVVSRYGKDNVELWFFDTQIEDAGLYRFLEECQYRLAMPIQRFSDGRNPWEVFRDERFIGNSRVPLCNRVLKRELLERLLRVHCPDRDVVLCLGYESHEKERMAKARRRWQAKGYEAVFPLEEPPFVNSTDLQEIARTEGVGIPRLYHIGFRHNNCGGACVQAGIEQWRLLWRVFPNRFLWHEEQEVFTREYLQKNVAILRDRTGGRTRPLTLRELRSRLEDSKEPTEGMERINLPAVAARIEEELAYAE